MPRPGRIDRQPPASPPPGSTTLETRRRPAGIVGRHRTRRRRHPGIVPRLLRHPPMWEPTPSPARAPRDATRSRPGPSTGPPEATRRRAFRIMASTSFTVTITPGGEAHGHGRACSRFSYHCRALVSVCSEQTARRAASGLAREWQRRRAGDSIADPPAAQGGERDGRSPPVCRVWPDLRLGAGVATAREGLPGRPHQVSRARAGRPSGDDPDRPPARPATNPATRCQPCARTAAAPRVPSSRGAGDGSRPGAPGAG
jgi:hypothetical protein